MLKTMCSYLNYNFELCGSTCNIRLGKKGDT